MSTRKEFIKQMMMLSGAAGMSWTMPKSLKRAMSIDPESGSSYMDAEHVVILMQENRSFDHCFGTLQGVRGYNDPRTITQPDGNSVWLQSDKQGHTYAPWRFDINDTKITWMGSIPHSRDSQIDTWNDNKYDGWIEAKRSSHKQYADIPLTMGHYSREDLPFNYAMADAFTVCDQNFCSLIGPTRPNRLFLFTGTNRRQKSGDVKAILQNRGNYQWKTMPEWLEENDISWRIYQNDISKGGGLTGEQRAWLANLGPSTNTMEVFSQYNVEFYPRYVKGLKNQVKTLPGEIKELEKKLDSLSSTSRKYKKTQRAIKKKKGVLAEARTGIKKWSPREFEKLPQAQKNLFNKAFTTNAGDPDYRSLTKLKYQHNGKEHELRVPKGDILYQFRKDVNEGNLPAVSWMIPSKRFSDHPSSPWYGSWFTSEILDILTKNPDVWKKTIFILTYDENDGYYDHVPPFTAPDPADENTGKCSPGINISGVEYTYREQRIRNGISKKNARSGPIGLGFRVPMIIASPWSRGGRICSEVFDQTSTLQFLEHFINEKYGKQIRVNNISNWRRTVCGDLTSAFQEYEEGGHKNPEFLNRDSYIEKIYDAKFKEEPSDYKNLSDKEIQQINRDPASSPHMPKQEPGTRPSCGLPYELYADARLTDDRENLKVVMKAGTRVFGKQSSGAPFKVYAPGEYLTRESEAKGKQDFEKARAWDYAVTAGDTLTDVYPLEAFRESKYRLEVHGPNGFFRELKGSKHDPPVSIKCSYEQDNNFPNKLTGNLALHATNESRRSQIIRIADNAYGNKAVAKKIPASGRKIIVLNLVPSHGWYDVSLKVKGEKIFGRRYAGRVETGKERTSDPAMGRKNV
jgi:phospholipase C